MGKVAEKLECKDCNTVFRIRKCYKDHFRPRTVCKHCNVKFSPHVFKLHKENCLTTVCKECNKTFQKTYYPIHKLRMHGKKAYRCGCGEEFRWLKQYNKHRENCTSEAVLQDISQIKEESETAIYYIEDDEGTEEVVCYEEYVDQDPDNVIEYEEEVGAEDIVEEETGEYYLEVNSDNVFQEHQYQMEDQTQFQEEEEGESQLQEEEEEGLIQEEEEPQLELNEDNQYQAEEEIVEEDAECQEGDLQYQIEEEEEGSEFIVEVKPQFQVHEEEEEEEAAEIEVEEEEVPQIDESKFKKFIETKPEKSPVQTILPKIKTEGRKITIGNQTFFLAPGQKIVIEGSSSDNHEEKKPLVKREKNIVDSKVKVIPQQSVAWRF